ncbi:GGDEF domain-containing protein [Salmonella enterica subsp. enterica serovar Choleraesuis]|nr:GGDEF domain-containing protein [Salmonella enterica subsp. enterica serovar Choleraesuis]
MEIAEKPLNEAQRLCSLRESGLLDVPPSERFDRLTRIAQRLFNLPIALVSLVDSDRLWFTASTGLDCREAPRDVSFCSHTILHNKPFIVNDALKDPRFFDNPWVLGENNVRFYAGCPLRLPDGAVAGAFCLVDNKPRDFSDEDVAALCDLAAIVEDEFAALNIATIDELTQLFNRRGFFGLSNYALASAVRRAGDLSLGFIDLDDFKKINDNYGHEQGDHALVHMASMMRQTFRETDILARIGGDEFCVLFADTPENGAWIAMTCLEERIADFNARNNYPWKLAFSWGIEPFDGAQHETLEALLKAADERMYDMKHQHRR